MTKSEFLGLKKKISRIYLGRFGISGVGADTDDFIINIYASAPLSEEVINEIKKDSSPYQVKVRINKPATAGGLDRNELKGIIKEVLVEMNVIPDSDNTSEPTSLYSIGEEDGFDNIARYSIGEP